MIDLNPPYCEHAKRRTVIRTIITIGDVLLTTMLWILIGLVYLLLAWANGVLDPKSNSLPPFPSLKEMLWPADPVDKE